MIALNFLAYLLLFIFYSPWLLFSGSIAFLGLFIKSNEDLLVSETVQESLTVCRILYIKKLLSQNEYEFETTRVATIYRKNTFVGYLFIMSPIIFILQKYDWFDSMMLKFVKRWIKVHHDKFSNLSHATWIEHKILSACVAIANNTGNTLQFLNYSQKNGAALL